MSELPLSDEDIEFLERCFSGQWEELSEAGQSGVLIRNYSLPMGYTAEIADLMVIVPADYPVAGLDMFYFYPHLVREDGRSIEALETEQHFDRKWQRWSRHYDWNPAEDSLIRHISYIRNQLKADAQ